MNTTSTEKQGHVRTGAAFDWTQLCWPGPRRVFSDAELARAGLQPWRRTTDVYVILCLVPNLIPLFQLMGDRRSALLVAALVLVQTAAALGVARWLWKRPTRTRYNLSALGAGILFIAALLLMRRGFDIPRESLLTPLLILGGLLCLSMVCWWAVVMLRAQQIAGRLTELDDQERNIRLVRRLATAQIQPHFLFNTLASVQHWVDTQDPRAAPTLRAFTQYLRSTLPMFERETLSLAEELQIVRHYLVIMQARLGERLAWGIEADAALNELTLPPGTLLTLVENAIAHGIEPALRGGRIDVSAARVAGQLVLDVSDNGSGPCAEAPEGVGLANTRARLQHQFGAKARLGLMALDPGCRARIEIDMEADA